MQSSQRHLQMVDNLEVALSYEIVSVNSGDGEALLKLLERFDHILPKGRIDSLALDIAADSNDVHELLNTRGIRPIVQLQLQCQSEPERGTRTRLSENPFARVRKSFER